MQAICRAHFLLCKEDELQLSQLAQAEKFLTCFGEVPRLITDGPPSVLTEVFSGYSLSPPSECWEPHLGYDSFLLLPFQLITHESPCYL